MRAYGVKQFITNTAVVSSKDLGTMCWLPKRFIKGNRCDRVYVCDYPCKKTCKAVVTELEYLHQEMQRQVAAIANKEAQLLRELL